MPFPLRICCSLLLFSCSLFFVTNALATTTTTTDREFDEILSMDISDLTVTSVAKHEQKLSDTASAIYVITQEDIRRAGALNIPDALRLAPGLDVARVASNRWAISARGFNGTLSNKLLVLIDGRSVYTPVFSGVYWDDESTMIQDIDHIEVIRGPGASLWGSNAVDGIINIITKKAEDTQGNLVSAIGTFTGGRLEGRTGGKIDDNTYYRVYAQSSSAGTSKNPATDGDNNDDWYRLRSGFRYDQKTTPSDNVTIQGDVYGGEESAQNMVPTFTPPYLQNIDSNDNSYGGNILARWNHVISDNSQTSLQTYIDHYSRDEYVARQDVTSADIQGQHSIKVDPRNQITWGGGVRLNLEDLQGSDQISFHNENSTHHIINMFAQDEYALVPDKVFLTLGTKLEHNDYTGFELQPSGRISWRATENQTVWGAISRAVRTPSSIERDAGIDAVVVPGSPLNELRLLSNPNQKSEELVAYELGHRIQVTHNLSFDTALFYNDYDNLQTIGTPGPSTLAPNGVLITPYQVNNLGEGRTYGGEFAANWNVTPDWRLSGSYSYLYMDLKVRPGTSYNLDSTENLAPRNQFSVRSYYNVSDEVHWDNMLYYVSALSSPTDSYFRYDTRVAWLMIPGLEVSLIGRNLVDPHHTEFPNNPEAEFGRSLIAQALWKF